MTDFIEYFEKKIIKENDSLNSFFKEMKKDLSGMEFANCLNYILDNKTDIKLLEYTIREINKTKYLQNLDSLLNFISKDNKETINLKVLAIKIVANYRNKKAVPILLECLNNVNSNYKIKFAAAEALGKIGDKTSFQALATLAQNEDEKSSYVKESAVVALGMLGDSRAIDVFEMILNGKQIFLDKFSYLKERIIEAISKLDISKDKKAVEILKKSLVDVDPRIRISTIETIMNSDISEAFELIYDRLKYDCDLEVQKNALIALYNISDRTILDEVINGEFIEELKITAKEILREWEDE